MLMFGEIRPAIEFNPGRVRFPAVSNHQMANPRKIALAGQLTFSSESRISRCNFWVVPQKFQNREHPILAEKTGLAEKPGAIRILETIDGIAQQSRVSRVQ